MPTWKWASTPPGMTSFPRASTSVSASDGAIESAMSTTLPSRAATSARMVPTNGMTSVPFTTARSKRDIAAQPSLATDPRRAFASAERCSARLYARPYHARMRGVLVRAFGGLDAMEVAELPDPVPGPGQVLVRVHASGVNFAETRTRAGTYSGVSAPFVLGMESAGVVESLGPGVADFAPGQRVFGRARGSHAEKVVIDARHLLPLPDRLSFEQGAAIPVGWLTAWHALLTVAHVEPGQRVLIEAVGSSVGSAALRIAKWRGCWVAGTASSDQKVRRAVDEYGADAGFVYTRQDVAALVQADTHGHGVDVALMTIGQQTAAATLAIMAMDGKVVTY